MSVIKKFFENKNTNLTKSGKSMVLRITLEMLENGIEPNSKNIAKVFKKILATDSQNINEERNIVEGLLKPENIAKIKQKIANV